MTVASYLQVTVFSEMSDQPSSTAFVQFSLNWMRGQTYFTGFEHVHVKAPEVTEREGNHIMFIST